MATSNETIESIYRYVESTGTFKHREMLAPLLLSSLLADDDLHRIIDELYADIEEVYGGDDEEYSVREAFSNNIVDPTIDIIIGKIERWSYGQVNGLRPFLTTMFNKF